MAAHWVSSTEETVTIYTAVATFLNEDEEITTKAIAVISNTKSHSTLEAQVFNRTIINYLEDTGVTIKHLCLWTDGAAAHFKNRYAMTALTHYQEMFDCTADWNFNESYHGKGPHDGIGALLKWNVYRRVLQGNATVLNAQDFYNTAKKFTGKTTVMYVTKEDIDNQKTKYESFWKKTRPVKCIQKARSVKVVCRNTIRLYLTSNDKEHFAQYYLLNVEVPDSDHESELSFSSFEIDSIIDNTENENSFTFSLDLSAASTNDVGCERLPGSFVLVKYCGKKESKAQCSSY